MKNSSKAILATCLVALASFIFFSFFYIFYFKNKIFLEFIGYFSLCSGVFAMLSGSLVKGFGEKLYPDRGVQRQIYGGVRNDFSGAIDNFNWSRSIRDEKFFFSFFILMILSFCFMVGSAISFAIVRFI